MRTGDDASDNYNDEGVHVQASKDEESDNRHPLRYRHVHAPKPWYRQHEDDQISDNINRGDGVSNQVIIYAMTVRYRSVPVVG